MKEPLGHCLPIIIKQVQTIINMVNEICLVSHNSYLETALELPISSYIIPGPPDASPDNVSVSLTKTFLECIEALRVRAAIRCSSLHSGTSHLRFPLLQQKGEKKGKKKETLKEYDEIEIDRKDD